jgi:hypothetical protein
MSKPTQTNMKTFIGYINEKYLGRFTRNNYSEEGKYWYHPESHKLVPVTKGYHTREVMIHPQKFDLTNDDISGFYKSKESHKDPEREMRLFQENDFMDWSDEVVHGMHDKGWLRMTDKNNHIYLGGSNADHVRAGIKQLHHKGHLTPDHSVTAHLYKYGQDGFSETSYHMNQEQLKKVLEQ